MRKTRNMEGGGGIERLADDLLSLIASHLSLEEAARACVLSSRWDKLWNAIPCLSFVSPRYPDDINDCSKYVQKVKRVLERRGGALPPAAAFTLNSLEFGHLLDRTHMQLVEDWFRYAMAHKVENLILDLRIDDPGEALETPPPAAALTNLKWLKTLKLKRVNLTKEFVELVLSNCRLLEKLVVRRAGHEFKGLIGLMKKCPRLQMLKIHAMLWNSPCPKLTLDHLNENRVKLISRRPHFQCLREVRIDGATWRTLDLKLSANIIERSPKLEKLTVKTRSPREVVFLNMEKMADILRKRVPAGYPAAIIVEE
uniref:F-box domain-containing protein n=1 Tax=Kalanchoe fedtschenkoi TaxID=63787 RepID=A0A7N0SY57_KALFE